MRNYWLKVGGIILIAGVVIGCGVADIQRAHREKEAAGAAYEASRDGDIAQEKADAGGRAPDGDPAVKATPVERKIIYTGTLDVVVKDLDAARAEVEKWIDTYKGYVAKSEVKGDIGSRRTATFTIRVPVENFKPLTAELAKLGTPERNVVDSQNVTEEFVDVQARIKNLKAEEEILNKLLKESGSRDEVLKTREQIRIIRGDIERAQARMDYLAKLSAMSTVNLTLREIKDYKPPTAPTFGNRASQTFERSWDSLVDAGQGAALGVVALVPWVPVLLPLGVGAVWMFRKGLRQYNAEREKPRTPTAPATATNPPDLEVEEPK